MTRIDVEDMALLEDEISQLRSENEYLKLAIDAANHENAQLRATVRAWEIDNGAEELAARPKLKAVLVAAKH